MMQDKNEDLDTLVNAFTYIDTEVQMGKTQKYSRRGHMQRIKAQPAAKDVSRGSINARDYIGAALNKLSSQCKALLLRITRGTSELHTDTTDASGRCPHGSTCPIMCPDCNDIAPTQLPSALTGGGTPPYLVPQGKFQLPLLWESDQTTMVITNPEPLLREFEATPPRS